MSVCTTWSRSAAAQVRLAAASHHMNLWARKIGADTSAPIAALARLPYFVFSSKTHAITTVNALQQHEQTLEQQQQQQQQQHHRSM